MEKNRRWDEPTFDPTKTYLTPKEDTPNTKTRAKLWERLVEGMSRARMKIYDGPTNSSGQPGSDQG